MKITFTHLGIIKKAELELNDLTIIAGGNNTGKTYITYSLYGFLKKWDRFLKFQDTKHIVETLMAEGTVKVKQETILETFDKTVKDISRRYSAKIPDIFSEKEGELNKAQLDVMVEKSAPIRSLLPLVFKVGETLEVTGRVEKDAVLISLISGDGESLPVTIAMDIVNKILSRVFYEQCFPRPFIATAERLGISLFYKELDVTKSALVEQLQQLERKKNFDLFDFVDKLSSRYALPIKDNINFIRASGDIQKKNSTKIFKAHADRIKHMMGGSFKQVDKEIRFASKARKSGKFDIPLYLASSSARGLSDIYFFLKYVAQEGMILMIDEPESHLSPANQVELARLLASCVNAGLKVFITTHSDYLIKEFNNLIMLGRDFEGKGEFLKEHSKIYSEQDYLNPDSVNAYICKNGTLHGCPVDEKGMDIESFDETIDEINRISDQLDCLTGPGD